MDLPACVADPPPACVADPPPTCVADPPPTCVADPPPTCVADPPPTSERVAGRLRCRTGVRGRSRSHLTAASTPAAATTSSTVFAPADGTAPPPLQWQGDPDAAPVAPVSTGRRELHLSSATEMSPLDDGFFVEVVFRSSEYTKRCLAGSSARGVPSNFMKQNFPGGSVAACKPCHVLALKRRDGRDDVALSTKHTSAIATVSM